MLSNELKKELNNASDIEFVYLFEALRIAKGVREIKDDFSLSNSDIAMYLSIKPMQVKDVLSGTYEYDLKIMAAIKCMHLELLSLEKTVRKKEITD